MKFLVLSIFTAACGAAGGNPPATLAAGTTSSGGLLTSFATATCEPSMMADGGYKLVLDFGSDLQVNGTIPSDHNMLKATVTIP